MRYKPLGGINLFKLMSSKGRRSFEDTNILKLQLKKITIMKQFKFLFLALAVAMMGISLTACGDDKDEPGGGGGSIVGTWEYDLSKQMLGPL